ncbi:unnamed protein product [Menidia menidia]|uniref:(Atlantic silverside) hypothetical protein n=1 Tax=Menidia menidia TaxID=238744 RepID=A0A8S4A9T1_9TELE|nr:unnamed protein product [Menidia menidia]
MCPEDSAAARGFHPPSSRGEVFVPQSRGSWRKTYSLRNKPLPSSAGHLSASTPKSGENSASVPNLSRIDETALTQTASILSGGPAQQKKEGHINKRTGLEGAGRKKLNSDPQPAVLQHKDEKQGVTDTILQVQQRPEGSQKESMSAISPIKPPLTTKTNDKTSQVMTTQSSTTLTAGTFTPAPPAPPTKHPSCEASTQNSQVNASFLTKSKFTWVKSQNTKKGEPKQVAPAKAEVPASSPSSSTFSKKTPPKKMARKLSPVGTAPKTSKYKWVSAAGAQARTPRKPASPKNSTPPLRSLEKGDAAKKLKSASAPSLRIKKGIGSSSSGSSLGSRYRWKAGGQNNPGGGAGAAAATGRRSAFHWTAEKSSRGMKAGLVPPYLPQRTHPPFSSPGGFKLRSRMKIVRRVVREGEQPLCHEVPPTGPNPHPNQEPLCSKEDAPQGACVFWKTQIKATLPHDVKNK